MSIGESAAAKASPRFGFFLAGTPVGLGAMDLEKERDGATGLEVAAFEAELPSTEVREEDDEEAWVFATEDDWGRVGCSWISVLGAANVNEEANRHQTSEAIEESMTDSRKDRKG
jgi:hypothetical protein